MSFSLKGDQRFQQRLQGAALIAGANLKDLPSAELPPLSTITVEVKVPAATDDDLGLAMLDVLWQHAERRPLGLDDEIEEGDELRVTCAGYVEGKLVPFTAKHDVWIRVDDEEYVGLKDELVGCSVGDNGAFTVQFGPLFPIESFHGHALHLGMQIHEGRRITLPNGDDPATWKKLGYGDTLEAAAEKVSADMEIQRVAFAALQASREVMLELGRRARVLIPPNLVDEEIARRWKAAEADALIALGLGLDEQNEAMKNWQRLPDVRASVTESLRTAAAAKTVIERDDLRPTVETMLAVIEDFPSVDEDFARQLASDPAAWKELEPQALQAFVVEHVMRSVDVQIVDAPEVGGRRSTD